MTISVPSIDFLVQTQRLIITHLNNGLLITEYYSEWPKSGLVLISDSWSPSGFWQCCVPNCLKTELASLDHYR